MTREEMALAAERIIASCQDGDEVCECRALGIAAAELRRTCEWTQDSDGIYQTACKHSFYFDDSGGPKEHQGQFCFYCGGTLIERPYVEPMRLTQEPT